MIDKIHSVVLINSLLWNGKQQQDMAVRYV